MFRFPSRLAAGSAVLLVLLSPSVALAHAEFVSGSPGPGEDVVGPPGVLVAVFSQELDVSRSSLAVLDASGNQVAQGGVLGDDPHELRLELPDLAPGAYEVRWTSFSAEDAELERGSYTFTVLSAPSPSTPTPSAAPDRSPAAADLGVLLPIGAAVLVAAVIGLWLLRRQGA